MKRKMKRKKTVYKEMMTSFTKSKGRFFSIFALMMIGSFALVGLKAVKPTIESTIQSYFHNHNTMQFSMISEYGISAADVQELNQLAPHATVEYGYFTDVVRHDSHDALRLFSIPQQLSTFQVIAGHLPQHANEIALNQAWQATYQIGDTIQFNGNNMITETTYQITGFVAASELISTQEFGISTVGTGVLNGYAVVMPEVFDAPVYTIARIVYRDLQSIPPFSAEYNALSSQHETELKRLLADNGEQRYNQLVDAGNQKIDDAKRQIEHARQQLADGKQQLTQAEQQMNEKADELSSADAKLRQEEQTLQAAQSQLVNGQQTLQSTHIQLQLAHDQLTTSQQTLANQWQSLQEKQNQLELTATQLQTQQLQLEQATTRLVYQQEQLALMQNTLEETIRALEQQEIDPTLDSTVIEQQTQIQSFTDQLTQAQQELASQKQQLATKQNELNAQNDALQQGRATLQAAQETFNQQQAAFYSSSNAYEDGLLQLNRQQAAYASGVEQFELAKQTIANGHNALHDAQTELATNKTAYNQQKVSAEEAIAEAEQAIKDGQKQIEALTVPEYNVYTRRTIPGGSSFTAVQTAATSIASVGNIFPVVLYLVAALVTMTTMTRFVHEERTNAGVLKALGYSNQTIYQKFIAYGAIASFCGSFVGAVTGSYALPYLLIQTLFAQTTLLNIPYTLYWDRSLFAIVCAVLCSTIPAYWLAHRELQEQASQLLIPKPPLKGVTILLERIPFIWRKMTFTQKVTARNIFRFKQRMIMTIVGVAGAVALLFAGLGLTSSISGIISRQFGQLTTYDALVILKNRTEETEHVALQQVLQQEKITDYQAIYTTSFDVTVQQSTDPQTVRMFVSEHDQFEPFISLYEAQTKQPLVLPPSGAILSEKIANQLGIAAGDLLSVTINQQSYTIPIAAIAEQYAGHTIYLSAELYHHIFQHEQAIQPNAYLLKMDNSDDLHIQQIVAELMALESVEFVSQNSGIKDHIEQVIESLSSAMQLLTVISIVLAIVILYNLTTINLTERVRELSTIKVLGFLPHEVTLYIYRETILLSLIGVAIGIISGRMLHRGLLVTVAPNAIQFNPSVSLSVYVIPIAVVCAILLVLGWIVHRTLRKLDMLEALKSVD